MDEALVERVEERCGQAGLDADDRRIQLGCMARYREAGARKERARVALTAL